MTPAKFLEFCQADGEAGEPTGKLGKDTMEEEKDRSKEEILLQSWT